MFTILRRVVDVREHEVRALFWACAYFFFLLGSWYVLRPIREEMGVKDVEKLPTLYLGTLVVTFLATPVFSLLVSRFTRERFIPIVYHALAAMILLFAGALLFITGDLRVHVYRAFYVWTSMFNMFAVSVFWGYLADILSDRQGKRLFGFIASGGTIGAIAGSLFTKEIVREVGIEKLLIAAALLLEAGVFCFYRLAASAASVRDSGTADGGTARAAPAPAGRIAGASALSGIRRVFQSPYLLGVCVYMLLFTAGSTFVYFSQSEIVAKAASRPEDRTRLFAEIDMYVNIATLILQLFATGRLIRWIGMPLTMAILPALTCGGFVGLAMAPSLALLFWFQVGRRGSDYAIAKPARDLLYTVVTREEKYTSKSFIDTFVYRGGDALAAWGRDWLKSQSAHPATFVAFFAAGLSILWLFLAVALGRAQERRAAQLP